MTEQAKSNIEKPSEFLLLYRPTWKQLFITIVVLATIVCLLRIQAITGLSTKFIGGYERDAGLYIWLVRSNLQNLAKLPWFETQVFYPYGRSLAWSDNFILPSIVAGAFMKLGLSLAAAYNLLILGAQLLNGYFTWRLTYSFFGKKWPSLLAGAGFMSLSWFSTQLGHPQNQFAFFIPWALLAFFNFVSRPALLKSIALGFIIGLAFLTTVYYSIFALVATIVAAGALKLLRPAHLTLKEYGLLFIGIVVGLLPATPFILPYLEVKSAFGGRGIYEAYHFSANTLSLLASGPFSLLYGFSYSWANAELYFFPGIIILGLSVIAFVRLTEAKTTKPIARTFAITFSLALIFSLPLIGRPWGGYACAIFTWLSLISLAVFLRRLGQAEKQVGFVILTNRAILATIFAIALVFFALSLGPLGDPSKGQPALGVYSLAYELIPGFSSIRATSRAMVVVLLCLSIAGSFGLAHIMERKRLGVSVVFIALVLIVLENINTTFAFEDPKPSSAVFDILRARVHQNDAVLMLPLATKLDKNGQVTSWSEFARNNVNYMHWALDIDAKLVNGYSGQRTNLLRDLTRRCANFPDDRCLRFMSTVGGLRFLVYSSIFNPSFDPNQFKGAVRQRGSQLELIAEDDQGNYLFELHPKTEIKGEISLLFPAKGKVASVELLAAVPQTGKLSVDILSTQGSEKVPLASISILGDGKWQQFSFSLPKADSSILPTRVFLKPNYGAYKAKPMIFLGSSFVQ